MNDRRLHLLQFMIEKGWKGLTPVPCLASPCGYGVQEAYEILRVSPGEELSVLDQLVDLGIFERTLHDKVHVCPSCKHFAINFRETCPHCQSHFIDLVDMLHHYACGYISCEDEFHQGTHLICPKCQQELRHLGVDYERATKSFHCSKCETLFPDPVTSCLSLSCGEVFDVERAHLQKIYTYRLTEQGVSAASEGNIYGAHESAFAIDLAYELYTLPYFREQLILEIRRATRFDRPFSIVMLQPPYLEQYEEEGGQEAVRNILKQLSVWVKALSRDCDILSLYQEKNFLLLLPETSNDSAMGIAKRICCHVEESSQQELGTTMHMRIGCSTYSSDIESADHMIQLVMTQVQEEGRLTEGVSAVSL